MNSNALSLPNLYKNILKKYINRTQKIAFYTLFYGVDYDSKGNIVVVQESSISQHLNGKKPLPMNLRTSIQDTDDDELEKRIDALAIQDTKSCADRVEEFVKNSSLSETAKQNLLDKYDKQKPSQFLGLVFREAVKWCEDDSFANNSSQHSCSSSKSNINDGLEKEKKEQLSQGHIDDGNITYEKVDGKNEVVVKELGLSPSIEAIEEDNMEEKLRKYREKFELYKELGIIDCTKALKETKLAPLQCMPNVKKSLDFTGVGGEKWVKDEQLRRAFSTMLMRTEAVGGEVRFLLIDPDSDAYRMLYSLRGESVPYESYASFIELIKKHSNLHVRLYDHMPSFRMQFVDEKYLAVSRYYFDKQQHDKWEGGWKIPHLIIHNELQKDFDSEEVLYKWSLYDSFLLAYNFSWEKSRDISKWDQEGRKFRK